MNILINSIIRGFGSQVGRNVAHSVLNPPRYSRVGTGGLIVGTIILGSIVGLALTFISSIIMILSIDYQSHLGLFKLICCISFITGPILMYRFYTKNNIKYDEWVDANIKREQQIEELKQKRKELKREIEDSYINNKITEREYKVLMKDFEK
jgi:type III secretory pathway component EscU